MKIFFVTLFIEWERSILINAHKLINVYTVTGFTYIKKTPVEGSYRYIYFGHSDMLMVMIEMKIEINEMIESPANIKQ